MIRKVSRTRKGEPKCRKHNWQFKASFRVFRGKHGQVRGHVTEFRCEHCEARGEEFVRERS